MRQATPPIVLAGRFRLESLLGQGGMGAVHRATDLRLAREVAVKVVPPHVDGAEIRARFLREAQRTAQVRHPNVVEVFDVGETPEGELFLVMELLRGEPLSKRLARERHLDLVTFARVAGEICDGLGAAHALGIVHRDVKPANVMLVAHGGRHDLVKVVDFGIAKAEATATALTEADTLLGTLEYISPEQILGDPPLDARSDVYSLGVVLYLMLTGTHVFHGVPRSGLLHHHLAVEPEPPSIRAPAASIAPALEAVLMRCLAKDPLARYPNASALRVALDEVSVANEGKASRPSRAPEIAPRSAPPRAEPHPADPMLDDPATELFASSRESGPVLELAEVPRTALMARPAHVCARCGAALPAGGGACMACLDGAAFVGRAPPSTREPPRAGGLIAWLLPPTWLTVTVALGCPVAVAGLRWLEVESIVPYQEVGLVFVISLVLAYARRRHDVAGG